MRDPKSAPGGRLSRRAMLAAPTGLALTSAAQTSAVADDATHLCKLWLANEAETDQLLRLWGDVEGHLMEYHNWCSLTDAERQALPQGVALQAIDARLDKLSAERQAIAPKLPLTIATSRQAVMLKFKVVTRELVLEDFPVIHGLLRSAVRDLATLW